MVLDWTQNGEDRETHCVTALQERRPEGRPQQGHPKEHGRE